MMYGYPFSDSFLVGIDPPVQVRFALDKAKSCMTAKFSVTPGKPMGRQAVAPPPDKEESFHA